MNQEETNICSDCDATDQAEWVYNRSVFSYSAFVKQIVWRYKYRGQMQLAKPLGLLMAAVINQYWPKRKFILSYIPLHKQRLVERGFNQSELLAHVIGRNLGRPVIEMFVRQRGTHRQSVKGRKDRLISLQGAFQLKQGFDPSPYVGCPVLLVDDIYTTGTTLRECAKPLKQHRIENIYSITIAR